MKKNLLLTVAALFISAGAFSQLTWNVQAGMTMNNMSKIEDSKMKIGYTVGVGMDYAFSDMWSLQSGLKFVDKGFKLKQEESGNNWSSEEKATYNPMYLEIPILAAVKFKISDHTKIVINAGPYLAFGVGGKAKFEYTGTDEEDTYSSEYKIALFKDAKASYKENGEDWKDETEKNAAIMKRFDLGMHIGVGFEINRFLVGLSGELGFLKAAKSYKEKDMEEDMSYEGLFDQKYHEDTDKYEKISPKNMSFAISVGYKF